MQASYRPLLSLVSQVDELPWALNGNVRAYARAEITPSGDHRRVVEYLSFAAGTQAEIRADVEAHAKRELLWDDEPFACDDVLTCVAVRARFVDARTVRITTGEWPYGGAAQPGACTDLLTRFPGAIEVSARRAFASLVQSRLVERVLSATPRGLERLELRHFRDGRSASRAHVQSLTGHDDGAFVAGVPVSVERRIEGRRLEQSARVTWEDLLLVVEDQQRLQRLMSENQVQGVPPEQLDVSDVERVLAYVDERLLDAAKVAVSERSSFLSGLVRLLERSAKKHPDDARLSRRHYNIALALGQPDKALTVSERMLKQGSSDLPTWELLSRAALSRIDARELAKRLGLAHGLTPSDAARMARELVERVASGADFERAEWALLLGHGLAARGQKAPLASVPELSLGLGTSVRMVAALALAALASREELFGVHVLVTGLEPDLSSLEVPEGLWVQPTRALGEAGVVVAATALHEAQQLALSKVLDGLVARESATAARPVSVWVGFDPIGGSPRQGILVRLAGEVSEDGFTLRSASKNLAYARWDVILRQVVMPLERMTFNVFPPDELVVDARSEHELSDMMAAAGGEVGIRCSASRLELTCRGPLDDRHAARRALTATIAAVLDDEVKKLASGVE